MGGTDSAEARRGPTRPSDGPLPGDGSSGPGSARPRLRTRSGRNAHRSATPLLTLLTLATLIVPVLARPEPAAAGSRRWDTTTWSSPVVGDRGPLIRFTVRTEQELGVDADRFADQVVEVLDDPRSWAAISGVRFQLMAGGAASGLGPDAGVDMTVYLATPSTVDILCAPLSTGGRVSCRSGNRVVINAERWESGPEVFHSGFADRLDLYRTYVINHEIGHRIGRGHASGTGCRADRYAPVMLQQTYGLQGCAPNGWPAYDGVTVGREPDDPGPVPSGACDTARVFPWGDGDRPLDDAITRLYRAGLGREPDDGGLRYWRDRRAGGLGPVSMAAELLASIEGERRHGGGSHAEFVTSLYEQVLSRTPDGPGLAYWVGLLDARSVTRAQVLLQFADSAEHVTSTGTTPAQSGEKGWLARLYQVVFERPPDCDGARYWLWSPASRRNIVRAFIAGPEFHDRYGSLDDGAFVDALYRNVLGREPDAEGRAYWLAELTSGRLDRSKLVLTWTLTIELIVRTGTAP